MSNLVQSSPIESALIQGDLSKLTVEQRIEYFRSVCSSLALNPLTRPFEFITLNGKLTFYARKDCTDQLRKINSVSVYKMEREVLGDILTVTAYGRDKEGREDASTGSVNIAGLKGEALANAHMKCETKSKRRLTLSLCGLGLLDETEVESIPEARSVTSIPAEPLLESEDPAERDLGEYVIRFGKKLTGMKVKDVGENDLDRYLRWMEENVMTKGDSVPPDARELYEIGEAYLKSMEFKR